MMSLEALLDEEEIKNGSTWTETPQQGPYGQLKSFSMSGQKGIDRYGHVDNENELTSDGRTGGDTDRCPQCAGSGVLDEHSCPECGGTGLIRNDGQDFKTTPEVESAYESAERSGAHGIENGDGPNVGRFVYPNDHPPAKALDFPRSEKKINSSHRRVASVAVRNGDHVLMGKRRDNGKWTFPGGHVNEGEDMHEGALRELREETGIETDRLTPMADPEMVSEDLYVQPFELILPERAQTSMKEDPDSEVQRWHWIDGSDGMSSEIMDNLHVPVDRNVTLKHLKKSISNSSYADWSGMGQSGTTTSNELPMVPDDYKASSLFVDMSPYRPTLKKGKEKYGTSVEQNCINDMVSQYEKDTTFRLKNHDRIENPGKVDEALWSKAKRASEDAFGKVKWPFVSWWYEKQGGTFG